MLSFHLTCTHTRLCTESTEPLPMKFRDLEGTDKEIQCMAVQKVGWVIQEDFLEETGMNGEVWWGLRWGR